VEKELYAGDEFKIDEEDFQPNYDEEFADCFTEDDDNVLFSSYRSGGSIEENEARDLERELGLTPTSSDDRMDDSVLSDSSKREINLNDTMNSEFHNKDSDSFIRMLGEEAHETNINTNRMSRATESSSSSVVKTMDKRRLSPTLEL